MPAAGGLDRLGFRQTPLWFYVLAEAEKQYEDAGTDRLGPVGGQLLADLVVGALRRSPSSYLNANPDFTPEPAFCQDGTFGFAQLVSLPDRLSE